MSPEEKEEFQKLFIKNLGEFGVLQFNLLALKEEEARMFEILKEQKAKLEATNQGKSE